MINRVDWKKYSWILFAIAGAGAIFGFYARYMFCINTVWELPDEYGYLINAAYLTGTEWSSFSNMYYGWGYSILLLPFFIIGTKGTSFIRGAILVNALCTVVTYLVQIGLLTRLCKKLNKYVIVLMAFVMSFYPYIMSSNVKVLSESLLHLMTWVCILFMYKALETKRVGWYALLGVSMAYMFFVHTRSFVFIGTWMIVMVALLVCKVTNWKQAIVFLLIFVLCYSGGYILKDTLIEEVYSNVYSTERVAVEEITEVTAEVTAEMSTEVPTETVDEVQTEIVADTVVPAEPVVHNLLGIESIMARVRAIFTGDISIYIYSLVCKYLYLAVATLGTYQLGVYAVAKQCVDSWKKRKMLSATDWLNVCVVLASVMMICATTVNSPGRLHAVPFFFYGRYYEYSVLPVVAIGMVYFVNNKMQWKEHLLHLGMVVVSGVVTFSLYAKLESQDVIIDIFRMASFSGFAGDGTDYRSMVINYLVLIVLCIVLGVILNYKENLRWIFLLVVLAGFAFNNKEISELVIDYSEVAMPDNVIAEYTLEHVADDEVYYLDGRYVSYTARMQSLLGTKQLKVIEIGELDSVKGTYLIVQTSSRYAEQLSEFEKVLAGYYYDLYYIP